MSETPKVSIVIPTFNRPHLLIRAINAVLSQTYKNFEIIVVDSSTDNGTGMVLAPYLSTNRVKYVHQEPRGLAAARNYGVKNSSKDSKYVAFLDDDDEWSCRFLERMVDELENGDDLSVISSGAEMRTQDGRKLRPFLGPIAEFWRQPVGANWVVRKGIFDKENIWFDEDMMAEDIDFGIRVLRNHKGKIVPEVLWTYYAIPSHEGGSLSTQYGKRAANIEYFRAKNEPVYCQVGREAVAFLNFFVGKIYCQAGRVRDGRTCLAQALKNRPSTCYLLYYLAAMFCPRIFKSHQIWILKHMLVRG